MIYISRSMMSDASEIEALVEHSGVCNDAAGITGMLWFDGVNFVQALEGDDAAVESLFQRIRSDHRHDDIEIVLDRPVAHRLFGQFGMTLPDDGPLSTANTAFLIGLAAAEKSRAGRRMYDILLASAN